MNKFHLSLIVFNLLILMLTGCSSVPKEPPTPTPDLSPPTPMPTQIGFNTMAVVLLEEGDEFDIHISANQESAVIESIPATAVVISSLGNEELVGEELWVEIQASTGEAGWGQARYLTEYVSPEIFCVDPDILFLLEDFKIALENKDGELLSALVSPAHGLDLRYYRYGTVANYTPTEVAWAFKSDYAVNWGNEPGSGFEKIGTFSEIPLPMLLEVFGANYELFCNETGIAATFAPEPWPFEYSNINFYQVFKSGTEQYAGMDWRSWLVGVEYVEGEPYLFALIHFQ
ncbi:MAG: hypothetical protein HN916_14295 [Anaerolineae bacterium]|jgi:hypothetical protein|nr:hypothetical protein [Anaerolineae bacterium]MBT7991225.1 hypothetical protein [Anaerolineae bacterium]